MRKHVAYIAIFLISSIVMAYAADKDLSGNDKKFLKESAVGGMLEVRLGELAQQNAQSPDVKDFGSRMVTDHGKANEELKAIAQKKNEKMPDKLESKQKKTLDRLSKLTGADFDKQYMQTMVKDHTKDVSDFRNLGVKTKDPDLNAWATKTLPVLEDHLKQAREVAQKLGVDVGRAEADGLREAKKSK